MTSAVAFRGKGDPGGGHGSVLRDAITEAMRAKTDEPDLLILQPRSDFYCTAHPTPADTRVVIEVADTSLAYDLDVKVPLYARHGIPEVWVVEAATLRTHVFRTPVATAAGSARYADMQLIQADEPLPFAALAGADGAGLPASLARLLGKPGT